MENQDVQEEKPWLCNSDTDTTVPVSHSLHTCTPCDNFYEHVEENDDFSSYHDAEDDLHDKIRRPIRLEVNRHTEHFRKIAAERAALEREYETVVAELAQVQKAEKTVNEHIRILQTAVVSDFYPVPPVILCRRCKVTLAPEMPHMLPVLEFELARPSPPPRSLPRSESFHTSPPSHL
jgi:hypothetical protein